MILTIDNLDGNGAMDYSAALCADAPLSIERVLNTPSRCSGALQVGSPANSGASSALLVPVRRGRVVVTSLSGAVLFTGYLATEPVPVYVGTGLAGPVYRVAFSAISDEWLLDKQSLTLTADGFTVPAGSLLQTLTARTASGLFKHNGGAERPAHWRLHAAAGATPGPPMQATSPVPPTPRIAYSTARSA